MVSKQAHRQTSEIIGVLDVGTSKTVCLIVAVPPGPRRRFDRVQLLGIGQQPTRGLKAGVVIEFDEAEEALQLGCDAFIFTQTMQHRLPDIVGRICQVAHDSLP